MALAQCLDEAAVRELADDLARCFTQPAHPLRRRPPPAPLSSRPPLLDVRAETLDVVARTLLSLMEQSPLVSSIITAALRPHTQDLLPWVQRHECGVACLELMSRLDQQTLAAHLQGDNGNAAAAAGAASCEELVASSEEGRVRALRNAGVDLGNEVLSRRRLDDRLASNAPSHRGACGCWCVEKDGYLASLLADLVSDICVDCPGE